ncbi:hypothetical protein HDU76_000411 [Blyttiomyces sp. JEL0837]|nr:hypothetical protein HDU76_000411 [Blyttiomyces sp. JEL0837]
MITAVNFLPAVLIAMITVAEPPLTSAQCVNISSILTSSDLTKVPLSFVTSTNPNATFVSIDDCTTYCGTKGFSLVGLQYIERRVTTGMSGCSVYDGSFCFCAKDLGDAKSIPVGFDSMNIGDGFCGDCNTGLSCGAGARTVDNPSQFKGKTCGIKYIFDVEGTQHPGNTTIKNALFFYTIGSSSATSQKPTGTVTESSTETSVSTYLASSTSVSISTEYVDITSVVIGTTSTVIATGSGYNPSSTTGNGSAVLYSSAYSSPLSMFNFVYAGLMAVVVGMVIWGVGRG